MLNTTLATRRRRELGLTLDQVGARVGVRRQVIWSWETGQHEPDSLARMRAYAAALDVPLADLIAEPEPEAKPEAAATT